MATIELLVEKFRLRVTADRDEIPQVTANLARQFAGMLEPAAGLATNSPPRKVIPSSPSPEVNGNDKENGNSNETRKANRKNARADGVGAASKSEPINYVHDSGNWGFPQQEFTTLEKAVYVLYIVEQMTTKTELPAGVITATFNKHYKQAGQVRPSNISKYLGAARSQRPSPVDLNTTAEPNAWFLTSEGKKIAEQLVMKSRGLFSEEKTKTNGAN